MIEFKDKLDEMGRKSLSLNETAKDGRQYWNLKLASANFPTTYENTEASRRRINVEVIEGENLNPEEHAGSFLIPLELTAIVRDNDQTACFYKERHRSRDTDLIQNEISTKITLEEGKKPFSDPYLRVTFTVEESKQTSEGEGELVTGSMRMAEPALRSDIGESANGGVSQPLSKVDHEVHAGDKIIQPVPENV